MTHRHLLELAVLGAILLDPDFYADTAAIVPQKAMTAAQARDLYASMSEVDSPDPMAMTRHYTRAAFADQNMGMPGFIGQCMDQGVKSLSAAKELAELYRREILSDKLTIAAADARDGRPFRMPEAEYISDEKPNEVDFSALGMRQDMEWLIQDWLPLDGGLVVLAGEPAGGKTFICMDLALSLATGHSWLGMATRTSRRVLVVDEENSGQLIRTRYKSLKMAKTNGYNIADIPLKVLHGNGYCWSSPNKYINLLATIAEFSPQWVILDSLVRLAAGLDENSNSDMARFNSEFIGPIRRLGSGVIILHHMSKPNQYASQARHRIRGASEIFAAPDMVWTLKQTTKFKRVLEQSKNRFSVLAKPVEITFSEQPDGGMALLGNEPFEWHNSGGF